MFTRCVPTGAAMPHPTDVLYKRNHDLMPSIFIWYSFVIDHFLYLFHVFFQWGFPSKADFDVKKWKCLVISRQVYLPVVSRGNSLIEGQSKKLNVEDVFCKENSGKGRNMKVLTGQYFISKLSTYQEMTIDP